MARSQRNASAGSDSARAGHNLDIPLLLRLYEQMQLLRRFESVAQIACRKGETPGFLHLYIGEEATAVRRLADEMRGQDPRFAADLYAAADRHELV